MLIDFRGLNSYTWLDWILFALIVIPVAYQIPGGVYLWKKYKSALRQTPEVAPAASSASITGSPGATIIGPGAVVSYQQQGGFTGVVQITTERTPRFSERQIEILESLLRKGAGQKVTLTSVMGDEAAADLARQLRGPFASAGWEVSLERAALSRPVAIGITLRVRDVNNAPRSLELISGALKSAGSSMPLYKNSDDRLGEHVIYVILRTK